MPEIIARPTIPLAMRQDPYPEDRRVPRNDELPPVEAAAVPEPKTIKIRAMVVVSPGGLDYVVYGFGEGDKHGTAEDAHRFMRQSNAWNQQIEDQIVMIEVEVPLVPRTFPTLQAKIAKE